MSKYIITTVLGLCLAIPGYAQSEKNTQFHDEFGQYGGERSDWTSAAFNAERDMLFAPMIPKNAHSTMLACVMPSHFEYFDRPGGLGEDLKKGKLDLDKVMKYSVVRNPLGRFFSSHSQMEAFLAGVSSRSLHRSPGHIAHIAALLKCVALFVLTIFG